MNSLVDFVVQNAEKLLEQTLEHIGLTFISLSMAILIAVPAGILAVRYKKIAPGIIGFSGILQTIPSIALLGFFIPILGIGVTPAIVALFLYALLPILRNTYAGIQEVPDSVIEAARGMGMTKGQILRKVELPLALPVIFAGIRTATVINVGVATLAAYVGAGGLGEFNFGGISLNNGTMILAGAIPAALLAILFDQLIAWVQKMPIKRMVKAVYGFSLIILLFSFSFFTPRVFVGGLKAGFDPEFYGRQDGYPALQRLYDISFRTVIMNSSLMYNAIHFDKVDIIAGYATDGRIKEYDLQTLTDDKNAFPPYYCTPIINAETASAHPEVVEALNKLSDKMNDSIMTDLNYRVDILKEDPASVATNFLKAIDLWRPDQRTGGKKIVIGG